MSSAFFLLYRVQCSPVVLYETDLATLHGFYSSAHLSQISQYPAIQYYHLLQPATLREQYTRFGLTVR